MDFSKINLSSYVPAMPYKVRELLDKATNMVMNYTETEAKVVEATNDEPWGPSGKLLQELSQLSYSYEHFTELMGMLWKRCFGQEKKFWRRTYKSLLVLIYLIKNGSDKVVTSAREHLYDLKSLESYSHHDEQGKDQGINVRHKIKEIVEFIQDDDRLREERKKAKTNRDKYVGVGSNTSTTRYGDSWNDYDDSNSASGSSNTTKKKDFVELDGRWRSTNPSIFEEGFNKAEDLAHKMKELVLDQRRPSHEYSPDISDDEGRYSKKSDFHDTPWNEQKNDHQSKPKETNFEVRKPSLTTNDTQPSSQTRVGLIRLSSTTNKKPQTIPQIPTSVPPQAPVGDLLGDDDGFTPYVQAPSVKSPIDDDFGQFHEAPNIPTKQVISPINTVQPSLWPTATATTTTPSLPASSLLFDPFESLEQTTSTSSNLVQPIDPSSTSLFTTSNVTSSNDLDLFMMPTQTTQQSSIFFPAQQQQQQQQQSFGRPPMFQQQQQSMMFAQTQQQQFNKPNNNVFNAVFPDSSPAVAQSQQLANMEKQNTWTSAQGKIDISLNNLIPHTRGDPHKNSLPLNQLTSPTSPTNSDFSSLMMMNNNTQSIFSNSTLPMNGSGNRPILK
ncbi:unnamed protein product [Adineta steineri]|uniref:ENTH domain-containing protein n=1 Tax=Adineta steineri TaxID=433720 RepID=A0A815KY98_9BILA|nr:unnamed protein product [Adineta steineri]